MTIDEQIKCVERELKMRQKLYPKWVQAEKMSETRAEQELAGMAAVLDTLRAMQSDGAQQQGLFS